MGPSQSGGRKTMITRRRKSERLELKKKKINGEKISNLSFEKPKNVSVSESDFESNLEMGSCSTPKAERFRIPEIETCPPAPKKQRVLSNCSFQRSPIAFFAPPELELLFFFSLPVSDISV